MRYNKSLFDKVKTGNFLGVNRPNGRVTVDPYWKLEKTPSVYGNSFKGPFRYYTNYDAASSTPGVEEYEIPSIKSIQWNRSTSQDLGSCTITLYNMWHNLNSEEQELAGQLGKKGYFWPKRGQGDSSTTWNQEAGKGAYRKDGTWDAQFSWENVLVEDTLLRCYEGYGGHPSDDTYVSIDENLDDGDLLLTGVWIVNTVSAGSDGMMTLECTDIGRILIDQIVYPPVIPSGAYPLEYYPPGKSAFDSPWGPTLRDKDLQEDDVSPGQRGEVWVRSSSWSGSSDGTISSLYPASNVTDGDWDTYSLSEAYDTMNEGRPYWEFLPGAANTSSAAINSLQFKPWGGGYTVYISIAEDPNPASPSSSYQWEGTENIPGGGIPYVNKVQVPMYIPDGMEYPVNVDFANYTGDDTFYERPTANTYHAKRIRLTFENLNYSHVADGTKRYRAGIRDLTLYREGSNFSDYAPISGSTPWTFCIEQHPVRGYWVIDSTGRVYGFGDASDYDFNRFGDVPISDYGPNNRAVGIAAHPSGEGYWVVDWMGHVFAYGASQQLGWTAVPDPYVGWNQQGKVQVRGIASTHTGDGYWVVYSNGIIRGFGDASPSYAVVPANDVAIFMDAFLSANYDIGKYVPYSIGLKATAIASHPTKMGFWVTDGSGQVWGFGACASFGGLVNRVYNEGMAGRFKLQPLEWATAIESTPSGNGYWIAFGSGRVASFGDAKSLGKDPYVINSMYQDFSLEEENVIYDDNIEFDNSFFRRIMWGLARDPSGTGFWVLAANGDVTPYDADFWGEPGYTGLTGYKWHEGNFNGDWCVDSETEILTQRGWLKNEDLKVGDLTYSIDPNTGFGQWKSIKDIHIFNAKPRKMLEIENQQHFSLTTLNHNWLIEDWKGNLRFKKSSELAQGQKIIRSAVLDKKTKVLDDDFVELVAWFTAEGWVDNGRVRFSQSLDKNKDYHDRIVSLLTRIYGAPGNMSNGVTRYPQMIDAVNAVKEGMSFSQASKKYNISIGGIKVWFKKNIESIPLASNWGLEKVTKNGIRTFSIRKDNSEEILKFVENKGKTPSWEFVSLLTSDQARLFIDVFCMGDGNKTDDIHRGVAQKREKTIDVIQAIATLAGLATSKSSKIKGKKSFSPNSEFTNLAIHKSKNSTIKSQYLKEVDYDGVVWCPEVEDNHTWCARRNGHVFFTGNCELVKEILMWGGFLFYDSDIASDEEPSVYGNLESTGIFTDTYVSGDKFDKKTLMDVIKELTEVVGYRFRIDEEGRVRYESPNFWRAGNFDRDGISIYVDETGERVDPEGEGASPFIPVIHESEELLQYNVTLSSADKRSEIIIGTDSPNPKDPTRTGYVIHYPPHSLERVAGNTPTMRGIERTAMWISELFENEQERRLMAELIGLHAWFASRTGSCSISANPCLSIDDQVRIVERNTSETFIHLINSISSNNDLDTGEYTMDLSTNWLGDADDWVIKNKDEPSNYVYTVISENLDSWQIKTNRGLGVLGDARKDDSIVTSFGEFTTTVSSVEPSSEMIVLGDSMSYLDSTLDGLSNDEWPQLLDNIGFADVIKNGAMSGYTSQDLVDDPIVAPESTDILVVFIGANDQNESLSGVSPAEFYTNINSLLTNYPANQQLVVFPWRWTGYPESEPDPAPTPEEYDAYAAQAELVANDNDASFLHLGEKIEAISGSTWDDYIVDWIHPSKIGHEFIADQVVSALYASEEVLANNWVMEGNFKITGTISNFNIVVESLSNLGQSIFLEVRNSSNSIIFASTLTNNGQVLSLGSLGNDDSSQETYSFRITGIPTVRGTGQIRLSFRDGNVIRSEVEDSIVFLED